jgi:hypothetical protein
MGKAKQFISITLAVIVLGISWYTFTGLVFAVVLFAFPESFIICQNISYNWAISPYILFVIWIFTVSINLGKVTTNEQHN